MMCCKGLMLWVGDLGLEFRVLWVADLRGEDWVAVKKLTAKTIYKFV